MSDKQSENFLAAMNKVRSKKEKIIYGAGGQSRKAAETLHEEQMKIEQEISDMISRMGDDLKGCTFDEIDKYQEALNHLNLANAKKLKCLQTQMQIGDLESLVWNVSSFVTKMSVMLSEEQCDVTDGVCGDDSKYDPNIPGYIGQISQNCIFGVSDSWKSIETLNKCVQTHVVDAAEFHKFHHEVIQVKRWMQRDLTEAMENFKRLQIETPTSKNVECFLAEFEAIHKALLHWRATLVKLSQTAALLVPVDLRTRPLDTPLPVIALASYTAPKMIIREGELLTLIEGGEVENWKVSNSRGQEALVPSVLIRIPPPHQPAHAALDELKFKLLTHWTTVLKLYGSRYIKLLLKLYKAHYTKKELTQFDTLEDWDRENILTYFLSTEEVLSKIWSTSRIYQKWLERVGVVKVLLEDDVDLDESKKSTIESTEEFKVMVNSTPFLSDVTNLYEELTRGWEGWRTMLDVHKHPFIMLSLEQWTQLKYISIEHIALFWKKLIKIDEYDEEEVEEDIIEEVKVVDDHAIQKTIASTGASLEEGGSSVKTNFQTEEIVREDSEVKQIFTISAVFDSEADKEISFDDAVAKGIIKSEEGVYKDLKTGQQLPIQEAMQKGLIKVTMTRNNFSKTTQSSVGLITIKSLREVQRPYKVTLVKDNTSDKSYKLDEAVSEGLLDSKKGLVLDKREGKRVSLKEAMKRGLVEVEYTDEEHSPEEVVKRYAVRAVVDRKHKKTVTFREAVKLGLINGVTAEYTDNVSGEKFSIGEAMVRGYIRAKQVTEEEAKHLDLCSDNQLIIDRTKVIKKKIIQPLAAINAFKKL